jgi:phosphate transport system protein
MRFRSMLDLFREDNWSNDQVEMVLEMLHLGADMFDFTIGVMVDGKSDGDKQEMLYNRDIRINLLERQIRRRVVSRLSAKGSRAEIPTALIFMNVVKDAERIGDYIKNLHEVSEMMPANVDRGIFRDHLAGSAADIAELFTLTGRAFGDSDEETANKVIKIAKSEGRKYEDGIRTITTGDLGTHDAVCLVLSLRFFKRMAAHMSNIASTVVMPVDLIDFYDEPGN